MAQKIYQVKNRPRKTTQYVCEQCQTPFDASAVARWCPSCRIKRYRSTASTRAAEQSKAMRQSVARNALRAAPPEIGLVSACGDDVRHDHADPAQQRQQALAAAMDPWAGSACRRDPVAVGTDRNDRNDRNDVRRSAPVTKVTEVTKVHASNTTNQEPPTMANTHATPPKPTGTLICCDCDQPTPRTGNCQKRCPSCAETNKDLIRAKSIAKKLATAIPRPIGRPPKAKAAPAAPEVRAEMPGLNVLCHVCGRVYDHPGSDRCTVCAEAGLTPVPSTQNAAPYRDIPPATLAGLPVDIVQVRAGLTIISTHHGLIAQRALAADTALAQLQEAMA